jgi:hypothetical protein
MSTNMAWLDTAISKYLTGKLAQFRSGLEEGTGQPISTLQVDAALLLSDLCRSFNLDEEQHDYVAGGERRPICDASSGDTNRGTHESPRLHSR